MAEVLCLSYTVKNPGSVLDRISNVSKKYYQTPWDLSKLATKNYHPNYFNSFKDLISYLFSQGNSECDSDRPEVIVIDSNIPNCNSQLDKLSFDDKCLIIKFFFCHRNVIVVDFNLLPNQINDINKSIQKINHLISDRISRVETWTGVGKSSVNDLFSTDDQLNFKISEIINTMTILLNANTNMRSFSKEKIMLFRSSIMDEIDFKLLLSNHTDLHLSKLCHLLGHWSFPAHELSNDDLIYCVYLMLKFALECLFPDQASIYIPLSNELLGFVFMVRDTYKNGNPFHNFRHAVDVMQACFHYLVKLSCLPMFLQAECDPQADELRYLYNKQKTDESTTLTIAMNSQGPVYYGGVAYLNALQTLGLLIAALGHDVGHPGVTNAFMIQYDAPTALAYNERSVLELFHASIFINKVVSINWPGLLECQTDPGLKLTFKELIISCILATDMAEHFEYIDRLTSFKTDKLKAQSNQVKLISSLLIKCADISNVTRPLRVSSQWALVLSREFEEVTLLEKKLTDPADYVPQQVKYEKTPILLKDVLKANPALHKGQIFFIDTFAENLFKNIAELLPELKYTCDVIQINKEFWLKRSKEV